MKSFVNQGTYDEDHYIGDIKDNYPQQLLYYATLEINTNAFMSLMVGHMFTSTTLEWLAAVKSRFGVDYYQQMLEDLTDGNSSEHWAVLLNEHHIYACPPQKGQRCGRRGSSREGIEERNKILAIQPSLVYQANYFSAGGDSSYVFDYSSDSILYGLRGDKRYELSNHLVNVLAVITDRRIQSCGMGEVMYYEAHVISQTDYYPFGMEIVERIWRRDVTYRFDFYGKTKG